MKLWQIALPLGLYSVTSAMFFPVSQSLIYWKICLTSEEESGVAKEDCSNKSLSSSNQFLQTEANRIFLIGSIVMTLTAIISGTILGKLGDEKSRKLALCVPFLGLLAADTLLIFLTYCIESSPYLYVFSEAIFGICGGYVTILSSSFAYGSHLAKVSGFDRSKAISFLEGSIGIGSIIGFFCTSFTKDFGYLNTYIFMTVIHFVCMVLILIMDDIKPKAEEKELKQKAVMTRLADKLLSWKQLFKSQQNRKKIFVLIFCFSLSFFSFIGTIHIIFYYLKQRFHWDLKLYGYLKAPYQFISTLAILFLYPFLKTKLKFSDPTMALFGLVSRCVGRLWLSICWNTYSVYFFIILDSLSRFSPTAIRSMLSKTAATDEQGRVFSLISVVELICTLMASIIFHTLFPYSISFFPQISFILMGLIIIPPIFLIWFYRSLLDSESFKKDEVEGGEEEEAIALK